MSAEKKTFKIAMSERCYRFKPDALGSHAPRSPGVYEFVAFDAEMKPEVLFVGLASPGTLHDALAAHMTGSLRPTSDDLFKAAKDVYFDFVAAADAAGDDDLKDIAGALVAKNKPRLNSGPAPTSGRYASVELVEIG